MAMTADLSTDDDKVVPFQIEASSLRGRLARLDGLLDFILTRQAYPEPVATLLGETTVLAVLLASGLKFDGVFTLQTKGDAAVPLMVVDVTSVGDVRGYAKFVPERLDATEGARSVPALIGQGLMAFTVDQGPGTQNYQGLVELSGDTLAECVEHYFQQSEQIDAQLKLAVGRTGQGWRAGGLMIQRLPDAAPIRLDTDHEDNWRRAALLLSTATERELLDPELFPNRLLIRLFYEDGVRVYPSAAMRASCRCSRDRVVRTLAALPRAEVEDLKVGDAVEVTCEFCSSLYRFDSAALDDVYADGR